MSTATSISHETFDTLLDLDIEPVLHRLEKKSPGGAPSPFCYKITQKINAISI